MPSLSESHNFCPWKLRGQSSFDQNLLIIGGDESERDIFEPSLGSTHLQTGVRSAREVAAWRRSFWTGSPRSGAARPYIAVVPVTTWT